MTYRERYAYWYRTCATIIGHYKHLHECCNAAIKCGAIDIDGPLFEAIWRDHDELLEIIDRDGLIAWYIYDNDLGKKRLEAAIGPNQPLRPITTLSALARLLATLPNK
jgi:hypothetical protein